MWKRTFFLLALVLFSWSAFAQDNQASPANVSAGYVSCPTGEQHVFLYDSVDTFNIVANPKCDEQVTVLGRVDTLGGYLRVRTADGKEGYVPQKQITTVAPAKSRIGIAEPPPQPVAAGQGAPLAGPLSNGPSSFAYDVPRGELFGGYSYMSADWGNLANRSGMQGWNGSVGINLNPWLGVEGNVSGHYQRTCIGAVGLTCSTLTFMGGPRITVHRSGNISAFGHGLVGLGTMAMTLSGSSLTWRDLAWAAGGGVDYAVTNRISVRVGQVDFLRTQYMQSLGGTHQNNIRISGGVVFRVGRVIEE
jgi:hypothetical protein